MINIHRKAIMKKLIFGIVAVFFLQLGFIAYHASDPSAETSFLVVDKNASDSILAASVSQPGVVDEIAVFDTDDESVEPEIIQPDHSPENVTGAVYSPRFVKQTTRKRPALNKFVALNEFEKLRPVTVTYRRYDSVEFKTRNVPDRTEYPLPRVSNPEPKTYELSAKAVSPKKKKGLFARVIRKPYDWLKAVGSVFK